MRTALALSTTAEPFLAYPYFFPQLRHLVHRLVSEKLNLLRFTILSVGSKSTSLAKITEYWRTLYLHM